MPLHLRFRCHPRFVALALAFSALAHLPALAGEGHDHGDAAPTTGGTVAPRFAAVSDTFELVGILNGKAITLYLDRAADNSPVKGASIELDIGGAKFKAAPHGDAEYEVLLPEAPKPGVLPVTATVTAGPESDLLAGELDLHEAAHTEAAPAVPLQRYAIWGGAGLAGLVGLLLLGRRVLGGRHATAGAAA